MAELLNKQVNLAEIARLFLKLGTIAFGGPAASIGMFEDEVVSKRKWIDRQHFLDLVGATNLIPGPNAVEMAIHIGYNNGGIAGAFVGGISFMITSVIISGVLAYFYLIYGSLPAVEPFLYGIKPAVIIIILIAVYRLGVKAIKTEDSGADRKLLTIGFMAAAINLFGLNEIYSILSGGIFGALYLITLQKKIKLSSFSPLILLPLVTLSTSVQTVEKVSISLTKLFLTFLKIGAVWFGSGYILVAYFNGELVQGLHWLTRKELLDAIAVGQFTPGPLLSSATFIGYQIAGISGAVLATIGIVIPSFIFVLLLNPIVPRIRKSVYLSKFLDAVNVSAVAVMLVVAVKLGIEVIIPAAGFNWRALLIALLSAGSFLLFKRINSAWIVFGGAIFGYLLYLTGI